jgi:penicillin-binding protein 1B
MTLDPAMTSPTSVSPPPKPVLRLLIARRWLWLLAALSVPLVVCVVVVGYYYVSFARLIDARLQGERFRTEPRLFARPFELRPGEALSPRQLVDRLNDLGYAHRARAERTGEFVIGRDAIVVIPRGGSHDSRPVRLLFRRRKPTLEPDRIERIELAAGGQARPSGTSLQARPSGTGLQARPNGGAIDRLTLEAPLITALMAAGREKRRIVPLAQIPKQMIQAVLAIEDRRFYDHPGVDLIRSAAAVVTNLRGDRPYLVGGSTLTQQLVKNLFLTPEKTVKRKLLEQFMALVLERRLTKDEILELYLNEVYLGQRGSFAIHGVAEASRLYFGKDVSNVTLGEAATIAGVIQTARHSPFRDTARARERRNVVLKAMADADFISADAAGRAAREPLLVVQRALEAEAPYFVDYVGQILQEWRPDFAAGSRAVDVYTTLDLHLQRLAQDAMREGLAQVDAILARRRRPRAQAALIAANPRTGDVLALVGGRSYNQSQFNRAVNARRQPGSAFKPFVYLAAFERAAEDGGGDPTPATLVWDEPTEFLFEDQIYRPANYENEYDGEITLRRALAMSRNIATIKVAETAGYDHVAALWKRVGAGTPPRPYPSIALGVFEATPFEIATAYTLFANGGTIRPLRTIGRVTDGDNETVPPPAKPRRIAGPATTFLVTHMMRSVLNEGTGAGARALGFTPDAAGKSGTTNDLRDAWFVGFTPDLLTVVWVGLDDNQPLGLSGAQAALPIWTAFMTRALSGRASRPFDTPEGVTFADIDRDTGKLATPACPRAFHEAFLAGTAPTAQCDLHSW